MEAQTTVGEAIAERGYESRYAGAHVVKAYLKMIEEMAEIAELLPIPNGFAYSIWDLGRTMRREFDMLAMTGNSYRPGIENPGRIAKELADVQVTVFDMANGLSRLSEHDFDVVQAAVDKATADIERGVRK